MLDGPQRHGQRRHVGAWIIRQQFGEQIERRRFDERFVALKIDEQIGVDLLGDLGNAIRAAGMIAAGHHHAAAKRLDGGDDARIVGGDEDGRGALRLTGTFVDVLDEILAGFAQQRFAGQTRGSVAGGDDDGGLHRWTSLSSGDAPGGAV